MKFNTKTRGTVLNALLILIVDLLNISIFKISLKLPQNFQFAGLSATASDGLPQKSALRALGLARVLMLLCSIGCLCCCAYRVHAFILK